MRNPEPRHEEFLTCVLREGIAVITLERGALDITLDPTARDNFLALISGVEQMEQAKALLIINSSAYPGVEGQRHFLDVLTGRTGASLEERERLLSQEEYARYRILEKLLGFRKLVVGAMQGEIASPFFGLSLGFSIRLAADDMSVRFPRIEYDFPPGWPLGLYLPRYVGQGKAAEILLSGKPVRAATLAELELVHHVYPADRFEDYCIKHTAELSCLSESQISSINQMISPDQSEIYSGFKQSMTIMKQALYSALRGER